MQDALSLKNDSTILSASLLLLDDQKSIESRGQLALGIEDLFVHLLDLHIIRKIYAHKLCHEHDDMALITGYEHVDWISQTLKNLGYHAQHTVAGVLEPHDFNVMT